MLLCFFNMITIVNGGVVEEPEITRLESVLGAVRFWVLEKGPRRKVTATEESQVGMLLEKINDASLDKVSASCLVDHLYDLLRLKTPKHIADRDVNERAADVLAAVKAATLGVAGSLFCIDAEP